MLDKEYEEDFLLVNKHLEQEEYTEAADVISFYIKSASNNPEKGTFPINKIVAFMLHSFKGGFENISHYTIFIRKITETIDSGKFIDSSHKFN